MAKTLTRNVLALDVRRLAREARLSGDEWSGTLWWTLARVPRHAAGFSSSPEYLEIDLGPSAGGATSPKVRVGISWSACHYGGRRPWFRCPRCGRRCGVLYLQYADVACRVCHDLRYESQRQDAYWRAMSRAYAIRARLGRLPFDRGPLRKPRGMWRRKFFGLLHRSILLQERAGRSSSPLVEEVRCRGAARR